MSVDSIKTKQENNPSNSPSPKSFLIPIIIIVVIIAAGWVFVLNYNFSRLDSKDSENNNSANQEINSALDDLSQKLDDLKDEKIFTQDDESQGVQTTSTQSNLDAADNNPQSSPISPDQY